MDTIRTILIAERNRNVRELLRREMADEGYLVVTAGSAREAAELAEAGRPLDVLVLDSELPDADRAAMVRRIRTTRRGLPVIVHGHAADEAGEILGEKFTVFVKKSEDLGRLKAVVAKVLRGFEPEKYVGWERPAPDRPDRG